MKLSDWETPILFDRMRREVHRGRRWCLVVLALTIGLAAVGFCEVPIVWAVVYLMLVSSLAPFLWSLIQLRRLEREVCRRLDAVSWRKQADAITHYPEDWMQAAIECDEAHMLGDCFLCGAD